MNRLNCSVDTEERRNLIEQIKKKYPNKKEQIILAEINVTSKPNGELPSMQEYEKYLENKRRDSSDYIPLTTIPYTQGVENRSVEQDSLISGKIDRTLLDEVANSSFKSTEERERRVMLVARMIGAIATKEIEKSGYKGKRNVYIANHFGDLVNKAQRMLMPSPKMNTEMQGKFQKIQDNWQLLLEEASNVLFYLEGVSVSPYLQSETDKESNDGDENGNNNQRLNEEEDSVYAHKDGWMIKAREVDLRDTISKETRKILNQIQKIDKTGKPEKDDLGMPVYLNSDYAHLKLLETVSKINSSQEFDEVLKELSKNSPWVNGVIDILNKDLSLKAKFYHDLRKEFVPYWIQTSGNTKQVNRDPSIYFLFRQWQFNQEENNTLSEHSLYTADRTLSVENAEYGLKVLDNLKQKLNDYSPEELWEVQKSTIKELLAMVGIDFTESNIEEAVLATDKITDILNGLSTVFQGVKKGLPENTILVDEFKSVFTNFAAIFNTIPMEATIASFREKGKTYQSYSNPSYLGRLLNGIKNKDTQKALNFLMQEFGQYSFFMKNGEYRNDMLRKLASSKRYRDMLERKVVLHVGGDEFNDWDEKTYLSVMLREYFSIPLKEGQNEGSAYYYLPLLSDAPSAEFIQFVRYTATSNQSVAERIVPLLAEIAEQEIDRINMSVARQQAIKDGKVQPVANFDVKEKNSQKFNFFPSFNTAQYENGRNFLQEYLYRKQISDSSAKQFIEEEVRKLMEVGFQEFLEDDSSRFVKRLGYTQAQLEEFYYNNALMYAETVELTTTDLAYYKNLNDFQKRYKEVYGMTQRLYTGSKYGKPTQRYVVLSDIEMQSLVFRETQEAINKAVESGRITKVAGDYILSQRKKLNIADAQALRSLDSYRSVIDMTGGWTDEMEKAYQNIKNGEWNVDDFNTMYETIKPFTFTQVGVNSGTEYGKMKVPMQLKTSEYVLMAIYNTIAKEQGKSPILRALNDFMDGKYVERIDENTTRERKGAPVDFVIFESGVKAGSQGAIQLNEGMSYEQVLEALGTGYNNGIENPDIIHTLDNEDYGIQVQSPEHLMDHYEMIGSQFKRLLDADLPDNAVFTINGKDYTKQEIHDLYQSILTENIIEGFQSVNEKFSDIESIAEAIQKEMASSSRYTDEERKACTLVERNGRKVFNIPLYDPIQSTRIQQLLNSIIKKEVTKQTMRRATGHQLSSVGFTDECKVRYQSLDGHLIYTKEEFNAAASRNIASLRGSLRKQDYDYLKKIASQFKSYEEYRNSVSANSVAYWECYMGAYSQQLVEACMGEDGNLDITKLPDGVRTVVGLRIPTEAKYSMQPLFIKGFLPQQSGASIMMPADVVATTGSDFDFDSVYVLLKEFYVDRRKGLRDFYNNSLSQRERDGWENQTVSEEILKDLGINEQIDKKEKGFYAWLSYYKENYPEEYKKLAKDTKVNVVKYDYSKPASEQSKEARNNAMLEIAHAILTNSSVSEQVDKSGGFDEASRINNILSILRNAPLAELKKLLSVNSEKEVFDKLFSLSKNESKKLSEETRRTMNPLSPLTQTYFHSQNSNGGKMIGIYAVGNAAHASAQWANIQVDPITMFGKTWNTLDRQYNADGELISDVLAQFLAASVDNVKDPVLQGLNQNPDTGSSTILLARLGMSIKQIGLFLSAPINDKFDNRAVVDFTEEDLAWLINVDRNQESLSDREQKKYELLKNSVSAMRNYVGEIAKNLDTVTQTGRSDGIQAAAGPTVGATIARYMKLLELAETLNNQDVYSDLLDLSTIFDRGNYNVEEMRSSFAKSGVPFLQAATKCGVVGALDLMAQWFPHTKENYLNWILDKRNGLLSYISAKFMKVDDLQKLVDTFFNELFLYNMNSTQFFGRTRLSDSKTNNYVELLSEFPKQFNSIIKAYPELKNNLFIKKLRFSYVKGVPRILFSDAANLSKQQKAIISNDWAMLLVDPNPEIRNLGFSLFKYATLNGLTFDGPSSFIQFAPNVIRRALPDYINSLESVMENNTIPVEFLEQFVRNHLEDYRISVRVGTKSRPIVSENEDGTITVDAKKLVRLREYYGIDSEGKSKYKYYYQNVVSTVKDGVTTYYRQINFNPANLTLTYQPMSKLGIPHVFKEYYYGINNPATIVDKIPNIESQNRFETFEESLDYYVQEMEKYAPKPVLMDMNEYNELAKDPETGQDICIGSI